MRSGQETSKSETRGEQMLALRRSREAVSPPVLRGGFRPFFLAAALWAPLALTLWLLALSGTLSLPSAADAVAWHRHEMLFGFVGAAIAGYLLTAIPNWTGRLPVAGMPLAALAALWAAARAAMFLSAHVGALAAALFDLGFFLVLTGLVGREVIGRKTRNLPVVLILSLISVSCGIDHLAMAGLLEDSMLGIRLAMAGIVMMIAVIGGRIIPSFTHNWLLKKQSRRHLPVQPTAFDRAVVAVTPLALAAWVVVPFAAPTAILLGTAALLHLIRLMRWSGGRSLGQPFVLILHIAYLWLPVGLALLALEAGTSLAAGGAIHALTAGAMATMILAVMTRSTLSLNGVALDAGPGTGLIYSAITLGAVLRVASPLGLVDYTVGMRLSALLWGSAFLLFLAVCGPILFRPRRTKKPRA